MDIINKEYNKNKYSNIIQSNKHDNNFKGSLTVEASLLFPIIFMVLCFVIYLSLYVFDRTKLQGAFNEGILNCKLYLMYDSPLDNGNVISNPNASDRNILDENSDVMEEDYINIMRSYLMDSLNTGLFVTNINNVDIQCTDNIMSISIRGTTDFPFLLLQRAFNKVRNITLSDSTSLEYTTTDIRKISKVIDMINRINTRRR